MKKSILSLTLVSLMGVAGYACAADPVAPVTVSGGVVHFTGSVVDSPCVVDNDSTSATVNLGQVKTSTTAKTGSVLGSAKPFSIHLSDCALTTYTNAAVTFSGPTVSGKADQLAVNGGGAGASTAGGVAIQVLDNTGTAVTVDGSTATAAQKLTASDNYLQYSAQYIATADTITAGAANADANFNITYN